MPAASSAWQPTTQVRRRPHRSSAGAQRNLSVQGSPTRLNKPDIGKADPVHPKIHRQCVVQDAEGKPLGEVQQGHPVELRPGRHVSSQSAHAVRRGRREGLPPVPYSAWGGALSNESTRRRTPGAGRGWKGRLGTLAVCVLLLASGAEAVFTLNGVTVTDLPTREVVEKYTLARNLQPVRFHGTTRVADWLLDRPDLAATLARHLYPPLERYHVTVREDGSFDVNDLGALRGSFRLVARDGNPPGLFLSGAVPVPRVPAEPLRQHGVHAGLPGVRTRRGSDAGGRSPAVRSAR